MRLFYYRYTLYFCLGSLCHVLHVLCNTAGSSNNNMANEANEEEKQFDPSRLGTKQYWDEAYKRELSCYEECGDVGEIWYGEASMNRMVKWIKKSQDIQQTSSILDIGCGNGLIAITLAEDGYINVTGVDYSADSIKLAKSIAAKENLNICFMESDILDLSNSQLVGRTYDVCLDKGTYDAISLNPQDRTRCRAVYMESVACLLTEKGLFIITSCNWTKNELLKHFDKDFVLFDELPTPSFTFGGNTGNKVTSLVFRKKS